MANNIYCVFEKSGVDLGLSDTSTHLATPQDLVDTPNSYLNVQMTLSNGNSLRRVI
jgi:hypothetical protein